MLVFYLLFTCLHFLKVMCNVFICNMLCVSNMDVVMLIKLYDSSYVLLDLILMYLYIFTTNTTLTKSMKFIYKNSYMFHRDFPI